MQKVTVEKQMKINEYFLCLMKNDLQNEHFVKVWSSRTATVAAIKSHP